MGILSRAVLAAGAAYAIHKFRSYNAEVEHKAEYKNDNIKMNETKPFKQSTSTSENTMPNVEVTVEPSKAKH